jgi:hypothetical protein
MFIKRENVFYRQDAGGGTGGGQQAAGGQQQAAGQSAGAQQQAGGTAAEAWRQQLPESLRDKPIEEVVKWGTSAHTQLGSLNNDLGKYKKQIEELTPYQQSAQEWTKWWQGIQPRWPEIEKFLQQGVAGSQQQHQQQPAGGQGAGLTDDVFENWATMDPRQQAKVLIDHLVGQVQNTFGGYKSELQNFLSEREKHFQAALQQQQASIQNWQNLFQRVWNAKQQNPSLDTDKMLEEAMAIVSGKRDPLDLGMAAATADQSKQAWLAEQKKLWEAERKAEQDKQNLASPLSGTIPQTYRPPTSRGGGAATLKQEIAQKLAAQYGPGVFQGNQ